MPEPRCHSLDCPWEGNAASAHGEGTPAGARVAQNEPVLATSGPGAADVGKDSAPVRQAEAVLAGLPAHVMDELVSDLAEAVVAVLLDSAAEPGEDDNASSGL